MFRDWISGFSVTFAPPEQFSAAANGGQLGAGPTPDREELAVPVGRGNVVMVPVGPTWPTPTRFRLSMENHMFPELSDVSSDGFAKGPRGPIRLVVWPTVSVAGSARSTQLPGCRPAPTATAVSPSQTRHAVLRPTWNAVNLGVVRSGFGLLIRGEMLASHRINKVVIHASPLWVWRWSSVRDRTSQALHPMPDDRVCQNIHLHPPAAASSISGVLVVRVGHQLNNGSLSLGHRAERAAIIECRGPRDGWDAVRRRQVDVMRATVVDVRLDRSKILGLRRSPRCGGRSGRRINGTTGRQQHCCACQTAPTRHAATHKSRHIRC